jgi:predicted small secreted protein
MNDRFHELLVVGALLLTGCQTVAPENEVAARIIDPDDASRAALQDTVNTIMGTDVTIAADALTNSSFLTIENRPRPTMENPVPMGRDYQRPVSLRLVITDGECILVDDRNDARYLLRDTRCVAH